MSTNGFREDELITKQLNGQVKVFPVVGASKRNWSVGMVNVRCSNAAPLLAKDNSLVTAQPIVRETPTLPRVWWKLPRPAVLQEPCDSPDLALSIVEPRRFRTFRV